MNRDKQSEDSIFVPYDDNNIEHALAGPDYGQIGGDNAWEEIDSLEYIDFVTAIEEKIVAFPHLKITKF